MKEYEETRYENWKAKAEAIVQAIMKKSILKIKTESIEGMSYILYVHYFF